MPGTTQRATGKRQLAWRLPSLFLMVLIALPVIAGAPMPDIPKGKGEKCVEDTSLMRSSHMEMILHQRDETVHKGIRTKKHSLKECISCHAVYDSSTQQAVSIASPKHFCRVCHDYAAVSIDCFECHASKPRAKATRVGLGE
jgi:nitrate reductase cytochrome c-type subunit